MTLEISVDHNVSGLIEGAPAISIIGEGVRLTNLSGSRIVSTDAGEAAIKVWEARAVIVNQSAGSIEAADASAVAIEGSSESDSVINSGTIKGSVLLGEGEDSFTQQATSGNFLIDLGGGNDSYVHASGSSFTLNVMGGGGIDKVRLTNYANAVLQGFWLTGFEEIHVAAGAGIWNLSNFSGYQDIFLAAGASVNFLSSNNSDADIHLAGASGKVTSVWLGSSAKFASIVGSSSNDELVMHGGELSGSVVLGSGADVIRHLNFATSAASSGLAGTINGGAGDDTIDLQVTGGTSISLSGFVGFENLYFTDADYYVPSIRLTGVNNFKGISSHRVGQLAIASSNSPSALVELGEKSNVTIEPTGVIGGIRIGHGSAEYDEVADAAQSVTIINNGKISGDVRLNTGNDHYDGRSGTLGGSVYSYAGDDQLRGGSGADRLNGGVGIDTLWGNSGNDFLDGGAGSDVMRGGRGDDNYYVGQRGDQVIEVSDQGSDTVRATISYTLPNYVENLFLTGFDPLEGTGNGLANRIVGNDWNNVLDGAAGADLLEGRGGNDTYIVDNASDRIVETKDSGIDTIRSSVSYALPDFVEKLSLTGAAEINGTGNREFNTIVGNAKANILDGGPGGDILRGGKGNDTYVVDTIGDWIEEHVDEGNDTVRTSVSYALPDNVENLVLTGAGIIDGTGNSLINRIHGNAKANVLDGAGGTDTMQGRGGNDTYVVDNAKDNVVEAVNEGTDTVRSSVTFSLPSNVENLYLSGTAAINATGNSLGNRLVGNGAANQLNGAGGADTMQGRAGNDTYFVDHKGDTVIEVANEGSDRVRSTISYTLPSHVENLSLDGNAAINATGNGAANTLTGNRGNNILDGAAGADTMQGRAGNDTYVVDHADDKVIELANEGTDRVKSSISYTLGDHVENLSLSGSDKISGTGNALANKIVGNRGANTLKGEGGNDTLVGGDGADRLYGGAGKDLLEGGTGSDRFYFDTAPSSSNVDTILDFQRGEDKILLHGGIFLGLSIGNLPNAAFKVGTAATAASHHIIYNPTTGALLYDADGVGGKAAIQFAMLDNHPTALSASDFIIF